MSDAGRDSEEIGRRWQHVFAAVSALAAVGLLALGAIQLSRAGSSSVKPPGQVQSTVPGTTAASSPSRDSSTAPTTSSPSQPSSVTALGRDLPPLSTEPCRTPTFANGSAWQLGKVQTAGGRVHDNAYSCNLFSAGVGSLDFVLGRAYHQFSVTIAFAQDSTSLKHQVKFEIIGDGVNYLEEPHTLAFGDTKDVTVDVSNVSRLTLKVTEQGTAGRSDAPSRPVWASPSLMK